MINFADIFEKISIPILVVDSAGIVALANEQASSSFASIKVGGDAQSLWLKGTSLKKLLRRSVLSDLVTSANIFVVGNGQREYKVTVNVLAQSPDTADPVFVLSFEDLSPLRTAKSMRSDFVANVSHEIRSPLTAISGFVESLQDAEEIDDETRKLFLGMMRKEVSRMTNLVADLLSLSKVEVKERQALTKSASIEQALHQACESVIGLVRERGKQIELNIDRDLPSVLGKQDDLVRVFINLAENAVNYSREDGNVTVAAGLADVDNPLGCKAICITVTDEGEGIPVSEIPRLTERFYRVDKSRSRNVGGTGLGLAIVKHILVRHRGRLVIESTQGVGSTFFVYLPVGPAK